MNAERALAAVSLLALAIARPSVAAELPVRLSETGLYAAASTGVLAPGVMGYTPQYPLWTDGAVKRRWILVPEGSTIDASDADHWELPAGTRLWKEFAFERPIETRYMEKQPDGSWRFAVYVWDAEGRDATLAPERGVRGIEVRPGQLHDVPGRWDCMACHGNRPEGVLGFSALQLSGDRDPLAPHAEPLRPGDVDLEELVARGWIEGMPADATRPRIEASTPRERAVLGYLHGNCGACHQDSGAVSALAFRLDQSVVERSSTDTISGLLGAGLITSGDPRASPLRQRLASRDPRSQMPPLGTRVPDQAALALIDAWIRDDLPPRVATDSLNNDWSNPNPNPEERSR